MAQVIEAELDEQGRMVFQAEAVESLGLTPGATLVVEAVDDAHVRLRVEPLEPELIDEGGILVVRAEPVGDLEEFVRHEHDRRIADLLEQAGL